jgi:hypothetical protein
MNPIINEETYMKIAATYDELMVKQELDGEFVDLYDSLVYHAFSNDNLKEQNQDGYQLYAGID